jgi:pimeloyl-ACP methyl ester carboxylesterase
MPGNLVEVEIGGLRVAYRRAGQGPPLVLLHGGLADSREWRRQLEGLADEFTVVWSAGTWTGRMWSGDGWSGNTWSSAGWN